MSSDTEGSGMTDEANNYEPAQQLQWPDGMDDASFLQQHWQKSPLLMRDALPGFRSPLSIHELAGLALEAEIPSRLIIRDEDGQYHLEEGPFEPERFTELGETDWSLLINEVDKHLPALAGWLRPFDFLPLWRIDDLMISYAPDGASVGAHVDEYDVFLLQASGQREWSWGNGATDGELKPIANSALRLLDDYTPAHTETLGCGDMLYLPPGVPHHGVARGENCMTWSIGFRAPSNHDLLGAFSTLLVEQIETERYRDPDLIPDLGGEINAEALDAFHALWQRATRIDAEQLKRLVGLMLTEPNSIELEPFDRARDHTARHWVRHPAVRAAWISDGDDRATLYVDGEAYRCSETLARALCDPSGRIDTDSAITDTVDRESWHALIDTTCIEPAESQDSD